MGTNQNGKRFYQVKVKGLDVTSLKELGRLMGPLQRQAFRKVYGKILYLTAAEVFTEAVVSLTQYYDQPLRCFTFGDFQMVPTVEEFEEILGCPLGGRKLYLFSGCGQRFVKRVGPHEANSKWRSGPAAEILGRQGKGYGEPREVGPVYGYTSSVDLGVVLFPNVDGLVDLASIDAFLAYHHSKKSPVVAILVDLFDTFDRRCAKNSARIVCCLPALCVWLVLHLFQQDIRHSCPLQSYRSCVEKRRVDWDQHLAGIGGSAINWFPRWKEGKEGVLFSCGDYPNVPLIGTRGCINYNPALAIRQLGYPMRGVPTEESLSPFLVRDLGAQSLKVIQRVHKAWRSPLRKDKELRGICNGVIGGYHGWLRVHTRGLDWLSKLKVIDEENFEAPEEDEEVQALKLELGKARLAKENAATAKALEQETKRARKEEHGREKFRGALWGSNNELKLRREERDRSRVHGMILKEELAACARSKRSLAQHLEATEQSMLAIIGQYKEEFALTLNGSQDRPRLLAKAKAMAEVKMDNQEGVQEQMKADLSALKDQMASITEAMLKLQKTLEDNATATASNAVREAEPKPDGVRSRYSPQAYPYGLPPDFTPRAAPEDRIESGLRKGKFEYASNTAPNNNRRAPVVGTRKKEGDTHAVTTAPTWMKAPQNIQSSYQPNPPNFSIQAENSLPTQVKGPPAAERAPAQRIAPAAPRPVNNTAPDASYKYAQHPPPKDNFSPIPMAYSELWLSLLENHLVVAIPEKVFQPPYPKWYDPSAKCAYHSGAPGHNIDSCIPFKYKVQHLISVGWLSFQEEGPNVKTNPLASHGGASVNAVEEDGPSRAKRLGEVATSRRFIYQSLQAACMVSRGGDERDECLFHLGESHDMETYPAVEELLQRLMDWGQLEVSKGGKEEPHICMQSEEKKVPLTPKALVICFTRKGTGSTPIYPRTAPKPTPNKAVTWKYTPPAFGERVATEVDSLSAKVTNITGLSGVTRSGRVFASPHSAELPSKGKAPMVQEPTDVATPSKEVDSPVVKRAEKKEGLQGKTVTLEEDHEFLRLIQQSEFKVVEQLNKTSARISLLELLINSEPHRTLNGFEPGMGLGKDGLGNADVVDVKGNPYKYGLGYEPGMPGRRNVPSRFRADRVWPGRLSQSFTSAGIVSEEEVAAVGEEFPHDPPNFVQPCHPDSQVGNWRVISQSEVYTADSIYEGRFFEDPNNEGLTIDFDRDVSQMMNEEEEEDVLSPELERLIAQEEREMKPHQEETELVNLGTGEEKKEVKVGTSMTAPIRQGLITLLGEYQDVFVWSYQDMPGVDSDIVQHKLLLNPGSSPVKQKL
ncbi:hypothetical protein HKD37_12G034220 [Glycine soja]